MHVGFLTRGALAATAATLVLAGPGGASTGPSPVCGPTDARTVASDSMARVYAHHKHVYGCARGGQGSFSLGRVSRSFGRNRVGPVALAGTDAGYGLTSSGVDTISAEVVVKRLTDGRVLHRHSAITGSLSPEFYEHVFRVVVKGDGAVAWTAEGGSLISQKPARRQVQKIDHTPQTLLDNHRKIGLRSLRLSASELTWRDGSAMRSASLQ